MSVWNGIDGLLDSIHELRHIKKRENKFRIKVKVINEHMDIDTFKARLSEDRRFAWVDDLNRLIVYPFIFRENGKQVIYLPEKTHGRLDYKKMQNVAEAQKYRILMRWKHLRKWEKTKVENVKDKKFKEILKETIDNKYPYVEVFTTGTIDFSLFDNSFSPSFSADSFLINQASVLNFLKDMGNVKLLLTILSCLLIGFVIGFLTEAMLNIMYGILT